MRAKDEVRRTADAKRRPQVVELWRLLHVDDRKGHENRERDYLLHDLQLAERKTTVAKAVRGNLESVFEKGYAPTRDNRHVPGRQTKRAQMAVPRVRHEQVRANQQQGGRHLRLLTPPSRAWLHDLRCHENGFTHHLPWKDVMWIASAARSSGTRAERTVRV